ncbi:uba2 [Symbiodinium sp. KB8]|nr:uba2 [Symbiodinium sp. KB8]
MTGFLNIEVIDLDTIDVSNLNRQFLFRSIHVHQPKSVVAKDVVSKFNPDAQVTAHHGNIKDAKFGMDYFANFDIVMNALDNVEARRHVNRVCLATGKPLVEAGTNGFLGQAYVIKGGETECFDCHPKPVQKTFPLCTIRR